MNEKAKIGFVICYPFQYYVYKNAYKHLADAEFIVDLGVFYPNKQTEDVLPAIVALLEREGARYRVLPYEDYFSTNRLELFFERYDTLVSVWLRGCMILPSNQRKRLVHMTYGAGKELTQFDLRKMRYDLILAYGEYDSAFYRQIGPTEVIGNPKFDDWFQDTVDMAVVADIRARMDPSKKTVLYLPTHSDLSTIDQLSDELKKIGETYNVIAKLHYYTPREEPDRVRRLIDDRIILAFDDTDLLPLLRLADIVLSDNSSAIFDAILADKPIVVTKFVQRSYLDAAHRILRKARRGFAGALTFSGSIEQRIKRDGTLDVLRTPRDVHHVIPRVLSSDEKRDKRATLKETLFSFRDGAAGERAARAIEAVRAADDAERPLLYHLIKNYFQEMGQRPPVAAPYIMEYLAARERSKDLFAPSGLRCSVIVLPDPDATSASRARALQALNSQTVPRDSYEVFLIGGDNPNDASITWIPATHTLGGAVEEALRKVNAEIVCFTTDAHVVHSDWLTALLTGFDRFPEAAGVGGYVRALPGEFSPWYEYQYYMIARSLGVEQEKSYLAKLYPLCNTQYARNPAGQIANVAYRRNALPAIPETIDHVTDVANYLKRQITHAAPIAFIPAWVWHAVPLTGERVWDDELRRGMSDVVWSTETMSLPRAWGEGIRAAWRYRRYRRFGITVVRACLVRWLGSIVARIQQLRQKMAQL